MMEKLKWPTLEQRRAEARLCMMHRIVNQNVEIPEQTLFTRATREGRRTHSHQFRTVRPNKDCFKYSFVPRTVIQWNNIPGFIVDIKDPAKFRDSIGSLDLTLKGLFYKY